MKTALVFALFAAGAAAQTDAARARYKALLIEEIGAARDQLQNVRKVGAVLTLMDRKKRLLGMEAEIAALERELFAFENGLFPPQPIAGSADAQRQYRALLDKDIQNATERWKLEVQTQSIGGAAFQDVYAARKRVLEAQKQLAAFDAGMAPPVIPAPGGER